ncbi:MAG: hypothetical protein ACW9XA_01250 [Candidatus Nitrosopumilus sp. bin_6a]
MNNKLTIFAIVLVALVMISGTVMPSMATKEDNNGRAEGCTKANDNSRVGEKNPHCLKYDLCGDLEESGSAFLWITKYFGDDIRISIDEFPGTDEEFNQMDAINDGKISPTEALLYKANNC